MTVRTIDDIFRDFVIDGMPASGQFHPYKPDIRDTLKALLEGLSTFPDNRVIRLNNANEGTTNNIVVTASVAIPTAAFQVLYILNVTQENTGPVTVSGAINRALVTNTSAPIPSGYLTSGMAVLCIDTGSELRMLSYGDMETLLDEVEAAVVAAEIARDQAVNAASDAVSQGNVPIYSTLDAISSHQIPAGITAIRVNGRHSVGDGDGGVYVDVDNGSPDIATSGDGRTWYRAKDVGIERVSAQVANRLTEFDARDSRFGGGAKWNDIDDDTATVQAAIDYFATLGGLTEFDGRNAAKLHLPRGVGRISGLDITSATNVQIVGQGDGVTTLRNVNDQPCIYSTNVSGTNDAFRTRLENFCIYGPGRENVNAHGIDLGALNNGAILDVRIYASRDALRVRNNWQTDVTRLKIDGGPTVGGALTCYRGICLLDGPGDIQENALKIYGGLVSGCEVNGIRGECVTGTAIFGLEILACGGAGVYLGDSPSGKDLRWMTWSGGLIDTCDDLLVINRGGAQYAGQIHFSGLWMGYANAGGGQGDAIRLNNIQDATFRPDVIFNVDTALVTSFCDNIVFDVGIMQGYDRSFVGAVPVQLANTSNSTIRIGGARKWVGSPSTKVIVETGTSDFNVIDGVNGDGGITLVGSSTVVNSSRGFKSRTAGLANVPSGQTFVVVNHGLCRTPFDGEIVITPKFDTNSVGVASYWVDTITAETFTLHTNAAPSSTLGFHWQGDVSRG